MKTKIFALLFALLYSAGAFAQLPRVYNESIDPLVQIDSALSVAKSDGKYVVCQVGGNWCVWCLRFADFIKKDSEISKLVDDNFVYIHVNYSRNNPSESLMKRLNNPSRFGFPVFVVLNQNGDVIHIQDSSFLELGNGYDPEKVKRFFECWTRKSVENH